MELKEMLFIFRKYQKTFYAWVGIFVLVGLAFFLYQPTRNVANLTLNVTRNGTQKTEAYRYDDFYRLQADERFADTVVRWLVSSPRVGEEIFKQAQIEKKPVFNAARLSSQMIEVKFKVQNENEGRKIAQAISQVLNIQTQELNKDQREETWFQVVGSEPVVSDARIAFSKLFLASFLAGALVGFWSILLKHYFQK